MGGWAPGGLPEDLCLARAPAPDRGADPVCYVSPQDPLLRVQEVLNGTEVNLQHLTALVDCRSLHLVRPGSWSQAMRLGGRGAAGGAGVQLGVGGRGSSWGSGGRGCSWGSGGRGSSWGGGDSENGGSPMGGRPKAQARAGVVRPLAVGWAEALACLISPCLPCLSPGLCGPCCPHLASGLRAGPDGLLL